MKDRRGNKKRNINTTGEFAVEEAPTFDVILSKLEFWRLGIKGRLL